MPKTQIFCLGASTLYGVGGSNGGWGDLLKQNLHSQMYEDNLSPQQFEVYNFGVPGAVIKDIAEHSKLISNFKKLGRRTVIILQGGSNNAKAINEPTNYVSTTEEFKTELTILLNNLQELSDDLICLGVMPMNQNKVMPLVKDQTNDRLVYFSNDRIRLFEDCFKEVATSLKVIFLPLFDKAKAINWEENYQYSDGIHPNGWGHQWIYSQVEAELSKIIEL